MASRRGGIGGDIEYKSMKEILLRRESRDY